MNLLLRQGGKRPSTWTRRGQRRLRRCRCCCGGSNWAEAGWSCRHNELPSGSGKSLNIIQIRLGMEIINANVFKIIILELHLISFSSSDVLHSWHSLCTHNWPLIHLGTPNDRSYWNYVSTWIFGECADICVCLLLFLYCQSSRCWWQINEPKRAKVEHRKTLRYR